MLQQLVFIFHILIAVALVGLILLQRGKGASMGAAFGSGASHTVFGSKGSVGFLTKLTVFLAVLFFASSITLTYFASREARKVDTSSVLLTNVEKISKKIHRNQQTNQTKQKDKVTKK